MIILDGGMGQELLRRTGDQPTPLWATQVMLDHPEAVRAIHDDYFAAGAEIATTNTYAIQRDRLPGTGLEDQFETLHRTACEIAVFSRDAVGHGRIAGSLGPLGGSYQPENTPHEAAAAKLYAEIVALHAPYVDLHLIETASSVKAARGAVLGCAASDKPVWLAVSVMDDDGTRLRSGEPVADVLGITGVDALLINCTRPEAVTTALASLAAATVPLGAYANGFTHITERFRKPGVTVDALEARHDLDPPAYLAHAKDWAALGATIIGGCCEVGPVHIAALTAHFNPGDPE
jgi:S-methylmethionine-dependent homocysteine/selenocysteine methylase